MHTATSSTPTPLPKPFFVRADGLTVRAGRLHAAQSLADHSLTRGVARPPAPMLKVVHDTDAPNENGTAGGSLLDEIVRDGARAMLAAALQAEVAAYIDAHLGEVDEAGHRLVVRNGFHQPREVVTAAGAVGVRAPRVNDKRIDKTTGERKRFSSAILPAWARGDRVGDSTTIMYRERFMAWVTLADRSGLALRSVESRNTRSA